MGSRIYEFLADSFLFRDDFFDHTLAVSTAEIQKELDRYREFAVQNEQELYADAAGHDSSLALYSAEGIGLPDLVQAALYVNRYILQDSLFELTAKRHESAKALTKGGFIPPPPTDGELDVERVRATAKFMKELTPMVAGNFIKFVPSSRTMEDTPEIPLYASENYFEDALPAEILRKYKEAATVSAVIPLGEGRIRFVPLKPTRGISIRFRGDVGEIRSMYSLHEMETTQLNKETGAFTAKITLPDAPPSRDRFHAWVRQSVNQAARNRFRETYEQAETAMRLRAAFSTQSNLRFDVLRTVVKPNTSQTLHTANTFLNMDLPLLKDINIENLMKVRQEDGDAFANFRFALDQKLGALREVSDMPAAKRMAADALRELTEVQLHDVRLKFDSLKEKMGLSVFGGAITMAAAVQNQGWGLLSAAAAAIPAASAYLDYRKDIKRHPAFFLWKALDPKARKRS
jgi:hypothetical protein